MKSLAIRCGLCGHDNLFPEKYVGRTLSCAHCGESVQVLANAAAPVAAVPIAAPNPEVPLHETGLRRLNRALCQGLCRLLILVAGVVGGGWLGIEHSESWAFLGNLAVWVSCPAGAFLGVIAAQWIGEGLSKLMGTYRLALPGMIIGVAAGLLFWSQSFASPYSRLVAGDLEVQEWLMFSLCLSVGALIVGMAAMVLDAITNFTR